MQRVKVSYLIALYNKEMFIEECIESILAENSSKILIEICIVDDGSSDDSLNLVKSKYSTNPYIKIANFKSNKGKNAAYNKAFSMSSGEYICIFGADDIVIPNRTSKLINQSQSFNKSAYGKSIKYKENMDSLIEIKSQIQSLKEKEKYRDITFEDIVIQNSLGGGSSILKREHAEVVFPIPEHLKFEDWWISYYLTRNKWVIASNDLVTIYRIHNNNDCASVGDKYDAIKRDYLRHEDYLQEFKNNAISKKEVQLINKSLAIRHSFLGIRKLKYLQFISCDKSSLKIIIFSTYGSRRYYNFVENLNSLKRKLFKS